MDDKAQETMFSRLKSYCKQHCDHLWDFGDYASGQVNAKKAPRLEAILVNHELFGILLDFWSHGKMKDAQFKIVMLRILTEMPCVKTKSQYDDEFVVEWLTQHIHVQVTHVRDLVRYRDRNLFRLAALDPEDMAKMK